MDVSKILTEGLEISPKAAHAMEVGGRVLSAIGARAKDGKLTVSEALEVIGEALPGN